MQLSIHSDGFELTAAIQSYAHGRFAFALDRARHLVRQVSVRLSDINGPRGGNDKRCKVQITLPGGNDVVIDDLDADLYVAIDRAADRAGRTLSRRLERRHDHRHGPKLRAQQKTADDLPAADAES
jgi:putative sigma-54 modulation protein